MSRDGDAGASALEQARRLRAAGLSEQADRWEKGAAGEQLTRHLLTKFTAPGAIVLDDQPIAGSPANIDHIVINAQGVTVIDSKNYRGRLRVEHGTLWHGRYPMGRQIDTLRWETDQVHRTIATALPHWTVTYHSVLCVHGAELPGDVKTVDGVDLVAPAALPALLSTGPGLLSGAHITAIASILRTAAATATTATTRSVRRQSRWPTSPALPTRRRSDPIRTVTPPPRRPRPSPSKRPPPARDRRSSPPLSGDVKRILIIVGVLIVFPLAAKRVLTSGLTTASKVASKVLLPGITTPSTIPAPNPKLTFACPAAGHGWALTLTWPTNTEPAESWEALTAPSASGPWNLRYIGGGQPPSPIVTGVKPDERIYVRSGGVVDIVAAGPTNTTPVTAPSTSC